MKKDIFATKGKTICTLKESIDIAKIVLSKEDQASLLGRIDFLDGSGELEIFLKSVNDDLRSEYESEVRSMYQREEKQFPHCNHPKIIEMHLEADVAKCMELGLNNLFKTHIGSNQPTKDAINRQKVEQKQKEEERKRKEAEQKQKEEERKRKEAALLEQANEGKQDVIKKNEIKKTHSWSDLKDKF